MRLGAARCRLHLQSNLLSSLPPLLFSSPSVLDADAARTSTKCAAAMKAEKWDEAVAAGEKAVAESTRELPRLTRGSGARTGRRRSTRPSSRSWAGRRSAVPSSRRPSRSTRTTRSARIDLIQYFANAPGIRRRRDGQGARADQGARRPSIAGAPALMTGYVLVKEKKMSRGRGRVRHAGRPLQAGRTRRSAGNGALGLASVP